MRGATGLKQLDRPFVVRGSLVRPRADSGHRAGSLVEVCPYERVVRQLDRPLVGALSLGVRAEGGCTLCRPHDHLARGRP